MLQLHKTEGGTDYAEFLHAPKKRFTDFGMFDSGKRIYVVSLVCITPIKVLYRSKNQVIHCSSIFSSFFYFFCGEFFFNLVG